MSTTTDSRVVELRFDNKEFEANAQQTINTLAQLKQALETNIDGSAFDSLDRAARNVDLSGIQAGIDALTDRFSTLGIVGMTVIQNITNALTHTLSNAVSKVSDSIVSGGIRRAMNIENAKFTLQGILDSAQEVNEVFKNASASVDGTAYALDEAAKAASQLAASGVEAGDQMTNVLKGIAGVAATTNADYESISHIFTTAAGQGKIMTEQLRQLENRGLNAAAELAKYFNAVRKDSDGVTDSVLQQIAALTGAKDLIKNTSGAIAEDAEASYEEVKKAADKEYKLKKKAYDKEYKALQKSLNEEYNLKKAAYDEQYKALQKSLNEEIKAVQEANSKRLEEVQEKYQADVEAYRAATEERISLIDEEYKESIKLIDEERYNKIKAVDDQIKAIQEQAKAEQKALKDQANAEKRAEIESILNNARNNKTKQQAAQVLADFEAELAREQLAEDRANQIEDLQNQKTAINEEAATKKEEAQKKAQSAKEAVQTEANAELKAMQKAHQEELKQIRAEQAETVEAMREANAARLQALKESQTEELSVYKEGQSEQLEVFREKQQDELELFRENQNDMLKELKESSNKASKYAAKFGGVLDVTEADIRDMVSDGLISFDIFSEAMATTFGEHAFDANKTFSGAMSNIRAAFARTGAMFVTPLVEEGSPLIDLLNKIREKVNEFNKALAPVAHYVTELIKDLLPKITEKVGEISFKSYDFYHVWRGVYAIGEYIVSILKAIGDGFKGAFDIDDKSIKDSAKSFQTFAESLKLSTKHASSITKITKTVVKVFKTLWNIVKRVVKSFSPLTKLFGATSDDLLDVGGSLADVIDKFTDWLDTSEAVENFFEGLTNVMSTFVDVILTVKDKIKEIVIEGKGLDLGKNLIQGFLEGVKSVATTVYDAITSFCQTVIDKVKKLFGINSPSTVFFDFGVNLIQGLINGIKSIAENAGKVITDVFDTILKTVREKFSNIIDTIKDLVGGIDSNSVDMKGDEIGSNFISDFIKGVIDHIPNPIEKIKEFFGKMKENLLNPNIGTPVGSGFMSGFLDGAKEGFKNIVEKIKSLIFKIGDKITGFFNSSSDDNAEESGENFILSFIKGLKDTIGGKAGDIIGSIGDAFGKIKDKIPNLQVIILAASALAGLIILIKSVKAGFLSNIIKPFAKLSKVFKVIKFAKKKDEIAQFISGLTGSGAAIAGNLNDGFISGIKDKIKGALEAVKSFASKVLQAIKDVFGIHSPSTEMVAIGENLVTTLKDTIVTNATAAWNTITEVFSGLLDGIKDLFEKGFGIIEGHGPELLSLATGLAVLLLIVRLSKMLSKIVLPFKKVSGVLTGFKRALTGIAWDLKADAIIKFAGAFTLLVAAFAGLVWVSKDLDDPKMLLKLLGGFITLLLVFAGAAFIVISALEKLTTAKLSMFSQDPKNNGLVILAQGVKKAIKEWAFGSMIKSFAKSVAILVGSFFLLVETIKKNDPNDINEAKNIMIGIGIFFAVMSGILTLISKSSNEQLSVLNVLNNSFTQISLGFLLLAGTVYLIIKAIEDMVSMNVNFNEQRDKIGLIIGIFAVLAILASVITLVAAKINSGGTVKTSAGPILAFCVLLLATVHALKKVLKLDLSGDDVPTKLKVFAGILAAIGILSVVLMWVASRASGTVKAGGTILALCAFLITAIGAIAILGNFKLTTLAKGVASILFVMFACAMVVSAAYGVEPASFKTVLAVIAMLAACMVAIGAMSFYGTEKLIPAVASLCAVLLFIARVFSQLAKVNSKEGASKILASILVIGAIAGGLWLMATQPWHKIAIAAAAMSAVLLVYAHVFKTIGQMTVNSKAIGAFVVGSLSIVVIGGILTAVATQDWSSILLAGIAISAVLLTYGKVFSDISQVQANPAATLNFLLGSLSIAVIGGILTAVATQEWSSILAAGISIGLVLEAYADVFSKIGQAEVTTGQVVNFIIGSVAVAIIGGILTAVATQDWSSILSAGGSVSLVLEAYADAYKKISGVHVEIEDVFNFIFGALSLVLIGLAIGVAAQNEWSAILSAATGISEVLLAYKSVYKDLDGTEVDLATVRNFLIGAIAIGLIGGVLWGVTYDRDWGVLLSAATSISGVLLAMSRAIQIISGIKLTWEGFGALIGGLVAVAAVGFILHQASTDTNWADMLGTALSIVTVLVGLCVVLGLLAAVGSFAPAAAIGIGLLDALIADLAAVLLALGALTEYTAFDDLVRSGQSTLIMLGEALGDFFGAIVKGVMDLIGQGLEDIGTSLSNFMTNAKPFFDGLKEIDDGMIKNAEALVGLMLAFAIAELIDSIANIVNIFGFFTPDFATKFENLGDAIARFDEKTKGVNGWNVKNAAEAIGILVAIGDDVGLLDTVQSALLPTYADHLAQFAEKMPDIAENLSDVETSTYEDVAGVMTTMIDIMDHVKSRDFRDAEDLPGFGESLATFAGYLRSIGSYAADMDLTNYQNLSACAEEVIGIAKLVPFQKNGDSLLGKIMGDNDIGDFGRKVLSFVKYMGGDDSIESYAAKLTPGNFENLYNSAYWLLLIATAVPYTKSGISALVSGNNDIATFGSKLKSFTMSMVAINDYLANNELDAALFRNLKTITVSTLGIVEKLKKLYQKNGAFKKDFTAGTALIDFGKALEDFGQNVKKCGEKAIEGYPGFSGAIELLQKLQEMMPDLEKFTGKSVTDFLSKLKAYGIEGLSNFLNSFNNSQEAVTKAISTMFSNMSTAFTSKRDLMTSLGRVIIGYFINGIDESKNKIEDAAKEIASKFRQAISQSSDFKQAGRDAGQGFVNGIRDKIDDSREAGGALGRAAYNAARKSLEERSPSKKMAEVGSFAGEGFVDGFLDWLKASSNAGKEIGDSAREGLNEAINKINREIQNEEDFNPVITPILDLSNIEKNASAIGGMLNIDKPIALAANAGMSFTGGLSNLLSNIQASIPDNTNDDVVASINGLRDDLNVLSARVNNLQVVMDTGELVGVIKDPIDDQLGFNTILAERGVR